jgi:hypothetical protein
MKCVHFRATFNICEMTLFIGGIVIFIWVMINVLKLMYILKSLFELITMECFRISIGDHFVSKDVTLVPKEESLS